MSWCILRCSGRIAASRCKVSEGKVGGDKIFFKVTDDGATIMHEGTLDAAGGEIKLTQSRIKLAFPVGT